MNKRMYELVESALLAPFSSTCPCYVPCGHAGKKHQSLAVRFILVVCLYPVSEVICLVRSSLLRLRFMPPSDGVVSRDTISEGCSMDVLHHHDYR